MKGVASRDAHITSARYGGSPASVRSAGSAIYDTPRQRGSQSHGEPTEISIISEHKRTPNVASEKVLRAICRGAGLKPSGAVSRDVAMNRLTDIMLTRARVSGEAFVGVSTRVPKCCRLYCEFNALTSLRGIETMNYLTKIAASDNAIASLAPLSRHLSVTEVDLSRNPIPGLCGLVSSEIVELNLGFLKLKDVDKQVLMSCSEGLRADGGSAVCFATEQEDGDEQVGEGDTGTVDAGAADPSQIQYASRVVVGRSGRSVSQGGGGIYMRDVTTPPARRERIDLNENVQRMVLASRGTSGGGAVTAGSPTESRQNTAGSPRGIFEQPCVGFAFFEHRTLMALSSCLRFLRMPGNGIASTGPFAALVVLEVLDLRENELSRVEDVEIGLCKCRRLKSLDIRDNPVAKRPRFRRNVYGALRRLAILNDKPIERGLVSLVATMDPTASAVPTAVSRGPTGGGNSAYGAAARRARGSIGGPTGTRVPRMVGGSHGGVWVPLDTTERSSQSRGGLLVARSKRHPELGLMKTTDENHDDDDDAMAARIAASKVLGAGSDSAAFRGRSRVAGGGGFKERAFDKQAYRTKRAQMQELAGGEGPGSAGDDFHNHSVDRLAVHSSAMSTGTCASTSGGVEIPESRGVDAPQIRESTAPELR